MHRLTGIIAAIGAATAAAAQIMNISSTKAAFDALGRGEYLKADTMLKVAGLNADGSIRDEGAFQSWAQIHPMLTGEVPVGGMRPTASAIPPTDPNDLAALAAAQPRDAIGEIVRRARATSIVILNEAHDSPRDRAFALEVAKALRPLGYNYLAAEAFANVDDWYGKPSTAEKLVRDGFVRRDTGHYTKDPAFAGFVREALRLGYRPITYEQTASQHGTATDLDGSIAAREEAEANNLQAALRAHPDPKLLVYVGQSHVTEEAIGEPDHRNAWMAARLKRKTGIDPLTIDQTSVTDRTPAVATLYRAAAARIGRSSVFVRTDRPLVLGQYAGAVDLQIIHPARAYLNGRPTWLATLGGKPVAIPPALLPTHGLRLVQAFAADAPTDAVPIDQVMVEAGKPAPMLMVPPVKLRLAVQDPT